MSTLDFRFFMCNTMAYVIVIALKHEDTNYHLMAKAALVNYQIERLMTQLVNIIFEPKHV